MDVLEEGSVPILISLQQMWNLYMSFRHTPDCDYITCAAFGLKDFPVPISTTNHLILNLADMKQCPEEVECGFMSEDISLLRTAKEQKPSSSDLAGSLMHMRKSMDRTASAAKGSALVQPTAQQLLSEAALPVDEHGSELIPLETEEGSGARTWPEERIQQPLIEAPGAGTSESSRAPRPILVGDPADGLAEQQRARERRATLKKAGPENRRHSNIPIGALVIPEDDGQPDSLT